MADAVRASVHELVQLGRIPTDNEADTEPDRADRWEVLIGEMYGEGNVTNGEAAMLVPLLPRDESDSFGVVWTLVHVIESAPGWPLNEALAAADGPWADILRQRLFG